PTVLPAEQILYPADYPGAMKRVIESELGAAAVCLFLQGAAGDMSANPGEHRGHEAFGQAVGREALSRARGIKAEPSAKPSLQIREEDFQFPRMRINLRDPLV